MSGEVTVREADRGARVDRSLHAMIDDGAHRIVDGLSRQNSGYRHMIEVCDQIADATLTGADPGGLAQMLARLINKTVVLLDPSFRLRACVGDGTYPAVSARWLPSDPGIGRILRALATERRPLRVPAIPDSVLTHGCLAIPIGIAASELGYLLILDGADGAEDASDDVDLLIASYVATLFALTLANERTSIDLGLRYQGAIVDALVSGQFDGAEDARRKIESLGILDEPPYQVVVLRPHPDTSPEAFRAHDVEELRAALLPSLPEAALAVRPAEVVLVVPGALPDDEPGASTARLAEALERVVSPSGTSEARLTCGISDCADRADELPRLYREAGQALDVGARIRQFGTVVAYRDLGIYRLLLQIGDERHLSRFVEETLGPLIRYDATHKLGLVQTLSVFLNQRESLKQAARRLHVHANTVTYRLQRIEQLIPLDLGKPDDRLVAHVAVKILDLQQRTRS